MVNVVGVFGRPVDPRCSKEVLYWGMNLAQRVQQYTPNNQTIELIKRTKIVLLVGISGAGKDTVKRRLLQSDDYRDIVSYTTRAPRQNEGVWEQDGTDYFFIDEIQAQTMLEKQQFVEAKFVHGTIYGTAVSQIEAINEQQKIAVTDIDVQGVDEYKEMSSQVIAIFLLPPSYDEWRRRLSLRYETPEDFEQAWPKRFESAIKELTHALEVPYYHFIINDNLDETVRITQEITKRPDVYNRQDDEARIRARDLLDKLTCQSR